MAKKEGKLSKIQNQILTVLAAAGEVADTIGKFTYNPYPYLYASLGTSYREESINEAIAGLVRSGVLEKNERGEVRLATVGADIKKRLYQERNRAWDGKWRVVFFDIPEDRREIRDDLRAELKKLGFGLWQRSAWITPFDITRELDKYLRKQDLSGLVQILVGERFGELNDRGFAAKIWSLEELNGRYKRFLADWAGELEKESSAEERLQAAAALQSRYFNILADDPRLPVELLPPDWVGDKAAELFKKLKSLLSVSRS